ncbi:4Fe-4S dicluster domain-containing protein [Desulfobaculum bizertense]|uniref:Electron transport protein HydN n=1 Tax=Desulfobaculum bizertense DSM 18034 TaxID=1121442 RepID=A0A1T4WZA7_9BACT|nr:4Fe-4S dicluster domain-containing protein [Desulfobaculum bizertense]SKA82497.1 electron transport protein HydN [Desulfobaculum bizertense DSM 18034]
MNSFVVGDHHKCIGCGACVIACAAAHLDGEILDAQRCDTPFTPRVTLVYTPEVTMPVQCRQCEGAPCAKACPENAISFKNGSVQIESELCVGCKLCMYVCPFGAMRVAPRPENEAQQGQGNLEVADKLPYVAQKCDLCTQRENGPACVQVCPAQALQLVSPDRMIHSVRDRRKAAVDRMPSFTRI